MKNKTSLVEYNEPDEKPSVKAAKEILVAEEFYHGVLGQPGGFRITTGESLWDRYEDYKYTRSLSEAREWANGKGIKQDYSDVCLNKDDLAKVNAAVNLHLKNVGRSQGEDYDSALAKKQEEDAIAAIANLLCFMGDSPTWNGGPKDEHWHAARMLSAFSVIDRNTARLMGWLADIIPEADQTRVENLIGHTEKEIAEYYFKIGCLYRDKWWTSKHEADAIHGKAFDSKKNPRTRNATTANMRDRKKREDIIIETVKTFNLDDFRAKSSGRLKAKSLARAVCKLRHFEGRVRSGAGVEAITKVIQENFH